MGVVAFALSFLGVPPIVAVLLLIVGVGAIVFAVVFEIEARVAARKRAATKQDPTPEPVSGEDLPVVFQAMSVSQNDETDERNSRIYLHVRAVNRGPEDVTLLFWLGMCKRDGEEPFLWQQAREPGAHPMAILYPGRANAEPTLVEGRRHADLTLEFLISKDLVNEIREPPLKHDGREIPNIVAMECLRLRVKDLMSGITVERRLPVDET